MKSVLTIIACFALLTAGLPAQARDPDSMTVRVGYGSGSLKPPQPDYDFTHIGVSFNYNVDEWVEDHWKMDPPGDWWAHWMPYMGIINEPEANIELSVGVGLRVDFPLDDTWKPHIYGGTGPIYSSQDTLEQATELNFGSYAGFGLEYVMDERHSISITKAIRHFSNASITDPNDGVDISAWGIGYTYYF